MKTPFTDASMFFVSIEGTTIPVVSADAARIIEIRMNSALQSQNTAWSIIANANWKTQTDEWRTIASYWQNHTFVQPELPLHFPPNIASKRALRTPNTLQEARVQIAVLETGLMHAERQLREAEQFENQMVAKIQFLENKINDLEISRCTFGTN
jgi:hypothetical protein